MWSGNQRIVYVLLLAGMRLLFGDAAAAQDVSCGDCHETTKHNTKFAEELSKSVHGSFGCLDCHTDRGDVDPAGETIHKGVDPKADAAVAACGTCHSDAAEQYKTHGRLRIGSNPDIPSCASCHGSHDILSSSVSASRTHPANLPRTCGECHENLDLTSKYQVLFDRAIQLYQSSAHGQATKGGIYVAATCNDCHSTGGSAHRILSPGDPESSINHFNIPKTCGQCHKGVENDFWEGIHGQLVARGETDAPVCTACHGEHGIISPDDPRSPVSRAHVAEQTCAPCHESVVLNEKYGVATGRLTTFIDSYHGLKSQAGDPAVANCASCHGVHRILPSSDPTSTIHRANLRQTCGECHPGISQELAQAPIHGVGGQGLRTAAADVVEKVYIVAIVVIIGLMVIHWLLDLGRHLKHVMTVRPQIRRMHPGEVWQHALLAVSFTVLVVSGFALRYSQSWFTQLFFGWERGFELRGLVHRVAAVVFMITALWHLIYLATRRGRRFLADMMPHWGDFKQFHHRVLYMLGRRTNPPRFGRFSYVEKAEYWALVWGTVVMMITGVMLWFDNYIVRVLPKGFLDVALVVHFWEAWLATLAILVWHMYSTVFSPHVYPMNPSWITGTMPESMYRHEHPEDVEQARRETEAYVREQVAILSPADGGANGGGNGEEGGVPAAANGDEVKRDG